MIRLENVSIGYGDTIVVNDVTISFPSNSVSAILGPNGAGKTTLLRGIVGILKSRGAIYIDGQNLSKLRKRELARILSYISDIRIPDLLSLRVYEVLLLSRRPVSRAFIEKPEDYRIVDDIIELLNIKNIAYRRLNELSSGELRRVMIGIALVKEPKYILIDEPDSHLDYSSKKLVAHLIHRIKNYSTVIITTHDINFAISTADQIILLDRGRIIAKGSVQQVITEDTLKQTYGIEFKIVRSSEKIIGVLPLYNS